MSTFRATLSFLQSAIRAQRSKFASRNRSDHYARTLWIRKSSTTSAIMAALVTSPATASASPSDIRDRAHHNKTGTGFINPWDSHTEQSAFAIISKIIRMRLTGAWTNPDTTPPTVNVRRPDFLPTRQTDQLRATWLGHACYYVEFPGGLRVLFDPVFTDRCSPLSFAGPKRYTEMPCHIKDIPYIDAVIISHNHYDHLSHPTLTEIAQRHPNAHYFVPLGNKPWFERNNIGDGHVTELDWWEERELRIPVKGADAQTDITATIGCLPCQHTSARTPFDKAHTLWASWSVSSGDKKVWFGGDTGYRTVPDLPKEEFDYGEKYAHLPICPAFQQIGQLRGPFDLGLVPIGAYAPRFLFSSVHSNPFDAVNIFVDTQCKRALGIHWGTWVLTPEEVMEPPKLLKTALKWKGLEEEGVFDVCEIGESREF